MQTVGPPNRYAPHASEQDWIEHDAKQLQPDKGDGERGYWEELSRALDRTFGKEEGK